MFESKKKIQMWADCGDDFYYGLNGEEIDYELAVEFYEKAMKKKHPHATYMMGVCYELGRGDLEVDLEYAEILYENAANLGDEDAEKRLASGELYEPPAPEEDEVDDEEYEDDEEEYEDDEVDDEDECDEEEEYEIDLEMAADFRIMTADELCDIGFAYEHGVKGKSQDAERALQYYLEASENGSTQAKYNAGCAYLNGTGTEQDYDEAEAWFLEAAEEKNPDAYYALALIYHNGYVGDEPDYDDAIFWYEKAAMEEIEQSEDVQNILVEFYSEEDGDFYDAEKTVYWLQVLAENDDESAQERLNELDISVDPKFLGQAYLRGEFDWEKDEDKACYWLGKAAQTGEVVSMVLYASALIETGDGEDDNKVAAEWLQKAVESGESSTSVMLLLGGLYENGEGVEKDYDKALYYYDLAKANGDKNAELRSDIVSIKLYSEIDVNTATGEQLYDAGFYFSEMENNQNKAIEYTELAAIRGYKPAFYQMYSLLMLTELKEGSEEIKKAFWWLTIAAKNGDPEAIKAKAIVQPIYVKNSFSSIESLRMANRYKEQDDDIRARYWYNQLAILTDSGNCAFWAGYYYFYGYGTWKNQKDYQTALKWFLKAADKGDKGTQEYLIAQIYLTGGYGVERNYKEAAKWYEKAISADGDRVTSDYYRDLAYAYVKLGNMKKAEKYNDKAEKLRKKE